MYPDPQPGCNRLAGEKSPYLRQHAQNPVHWFPWGEEAFQAARSLDRPVFLSIGYSTCHWCHVMAHESFEDPETARSLNDTFVCIKVDREERPDLDGIYMTACQMLTGSGGWPLTIVMTPDKKPFFAATYLPKQSRFGRIGLLDLTTRIRSLWETRRDALAADAGRVYAALQQAAAPAQGEPLGPHLPDQAAAALHGSFDDRHGGFGSAPKFPSPHTLSFLLRHGYRTGDTRSYDMVRTTLQAMRQGGVYDSLGFGLHRYATDAAWLVPHFEKMLYDQALLATTCAETYRATGDDVAARMAREVCSYVLRDLTAPEGGFYAAEDADSEGVEGKFYVWTAAEIDAVLTPDEAHVFKRACNVTREGNFCDEATGQPTGANILYQAVPHVILAGELNRPEDTLELLMASAREKLLHCRDQRVRPHRDEKILTDWNGLMIAALALCGRTFDDPALLQAAERAATFVLETLCSPDNRLLHGFCDGRAAGAGLAADYACMTWSLLELYQATFSPAWLEKALALNRTFVARFRDSEAGGFFTAADDAPDVIVRQKEFTDGALPSPNSVAMYNLLRLGRITGDSAHEEMAEQIGRACSPAVSHSPQYHTFMLCALDMARNPSREILIAGDPVASDTRALLREVRAQFLPGATVVLRPTGTDATRIEAIAPHVRAFEPPGGRATAWVCTNFSCDRPVQDPEELRAVLENIPRADTVR